MGYEENSTVQTLLDAEDEASQIVARARKNKTQRLKEARDEAEKEIAEYRAQKERDFQAEKARTLGSTDSEKKQLQMDADIQLNEVDGLYNKNKDRVADLLVYYVTEVNTALRK
mmetsp:Transcript_25295/g.63446  ORF Transcript_25295/g.63446 Transcript_25295/m.63446 type:complete len:114 (+) Transcript_25295:81-422(+)